LLGRCLPLLSASERRSFDKRQGFHLLSSQLHHHAVNKRLADVCLQLIVNRNNVTCDCL